MYLRDFFTHSLTNGLTFCTSKNNTQPAPVGLRPQLTYDNIKKCRTEVQLDSPSLLTSFDPVIVRYNRLNHIQILGILKYTYLCDYNIVYNI